MIFFEIQANLRINYFFLYASIIFLSSFLMCNLATATDFPVPIEQFQIELTTCPICCEERHLDDERIFQTRCNHFFCKLCIKKWLKFHLNCPICRAFIVRSVYNELEMNRGMSPSASISNYAYTYIERFTFNIIMNQYLNGINRLLILIFLALTLLFLKDSLY